MPESRDEVHDVHDRGYRFLLSSLRLFQELVDGYVDQEWKADLDLDKAVKVDKTFVLESYLERESDVLYRVPLGKGIIRREGSDVTVVATSYHNIRAVEAADKLAQEGISVEVIDPRTIKPLDTEIILNSVSKTGRLLVADGGWDAYGFTAEVAAVVAASPVITKLKSPVVRMGLPPCPAPMSESLEKAYFGDTTDLVNRIRQLVTAGS